jgi:A/G-specific adenine glycosylase
VLLCVGLGYYSRARNLHKAAQTIINKHNQTFPTTYESLQTLPGIGPYSAAAISSIVYEEPVPVVDGNVLRVFCRFWEIEDDIRSNKTRDRLFKDLKPYIKKSTPSIFNQAIMECGALICKPQQPNCNKCPLQTECKAYKNNKTGSLPFKSKGKPVPHYNIAISIIYKDNKVLIAKRKQTQMLGGLWEFPGGKQEENEPLEQTAIREAQEECGISIKVNHYIGTVKHAYTHFKITLHIYKCSHLKGTAKPIQSEEIKWIRWEDLEQHPFPTANKKIVTLVEKSHSKKTSKEVFIR